MRLAPNVLLLISTLVVSAAAHAARLTYQPVLNPVIAPVVSRTPDITGVIQRVDDRVLVDWSRVRLRLAKTFTPEQLKDLTTSIYANGIEVAKNLPASQTRVTLKVPGFQQVDYRIVTKRQGKIVDISDYILEENNDGQLLEAGSFKGKFAGEHFAIHYPASWGLSDRLTSTAVRLGYKKIVWVLAPDASEKTRRFVENSRRGVDVLADYDAAGKSRNFTVTDRASGKSIHAEAKEFYDKVDAAFSGNAFFWDDMLVSLATVPYHPRLAQSTLRFWLMVQRRNHGVIPREVRKVNLLSFWFPEMILNGSTPRPNLIFTNPYLMDWTMDTLYRFDPSKENKQLLLEVSRSITSYTEWMEKNRGVRDASGRIIGFNGSMYGTGLDNSRGSLGNFAEPESYDSCIVDILSQQIAMLKSQARWLKILSPRDAAAPAAAEAKAQKYSQILNELYWNENKGFYFDLVPKNGKLVQQTEYVSIAGFWPLYAGAVPPARLEKMIALQLTPDTFGGDFPLPANARSAIREGAKVYYQPRQGFRNEDGYWDKWAHWPSMAMVVAEGFRREGRGDIAHSLTRDYLKKMAESSEDTVEENYGEIEVLRPDGSKTFKSRPGQHSDHVRRPDFAGWGKGPPIYLALEDAVGLDARLDGKLVWTLYEPMKSGEALEVQNLQYHGHTIERLSLRQEDGSLSLSVESRTPLKIEVHTAGYKYDASFNGSSELERRELH